MPPPQHYPPYTGETIEQEGKRQLGGHGGDPGRFPGHSLAHGTHGGVLQWEVGDFFSRFRLGSWSPPPPSLLPQSLRPVPNVSMLCIHQSSYRLLVAYFHVSRNLAVSKWGMWSGVNSQSIAVVTWTFRSTPRSTFRMNK